MIATPKTDAILSSQPNDGFGLDKAQCIAQWYDHSAKLERINAELQTHLYDCYCCLMVMKKLAPDITKYMPGLPSVIESARAALERAKQ